MWIWLTAAVYASWAAIRLFGLDRGFPLVQLIAFTPYAAVSAVATVAVAAADGRWGAAIVATFAAAGLLAAVGPRAVPDRSPRGSGGRPLRVLSANLLRGGADPNTIVDLVRRNSVDVLAVQELTPEAHAALDNAGLAQLLPERAPYPARGGRGSALYGRFPLRDNDLRVAECACAMTTAKATMTVPGYGDVALESAHPCAPHPRRTRCWRDNLAAQTPAAPNGPLRVLLGDFNATLDHSVLRRLLATGYRDAAQAVGKGLLPTWPFRKAPVPWVTLDHVLADKRIQFAAYATHRLPGSDHRAIYAELVLPTR